MGRLLRVGGHLGDRSVGDARCGRNGHRAHPARHDAHAGAATPPVGAGRADDDRRPALERVGSSCRPGSACRRVRAAVLDLRGRPRPQGARRAARRGARDDAAALAGSSRSSTRAPTTGPSAPTRCCRPADRAAAAHPHVGRGRLAAHEVDAAGRPVRRVDSELRPAERLRRRPARAAAHLHARDRRRGDRVDPRRARAARVSATGRSTSRRRARRAAPTPKPMPRSCGRGPRRASRGGSRPTGMCRPNGSPSTRANGVRSGPPRP